MIIVDKNLKYTSISDVMWTRYQQKVDYKALAGYKSTSSGEAVTVTMSESKTSMQDATLPTATRGGLEQVDFELPKEDDDINKMMEEMDEEMNKLSVREKAMGKKIALEEKRKSLADMTAKLRSLTEAAPQAPSVVTPQSDIADSQAGQQPTVAALGMNIGDNQAPPISQPQYMARMDVNPQVYLHTASIGKKPKYRSILDFIPTNYNGTDEEITELGGGVSIHSRSRKKIENVTPAQWVCANALILADILQKDIASKI